MGDPRGFLTIERVEQPDRDPAERRHDYEELHGRLGAEDLARQGGRCMDCGIPFCLDGCPLGNLIPDWNDFVHRDRWRQAIDQLHATNPFPELTGLICPAPCEAACVLEINDDPVTIKQIELAIIERAFAEGWVVPRPPDRRTGRSVGIVGSGPAGMAAADRLNRAGHAVTVYERDEAVGGLNRFGVPDPKLPKDVIERRVAVMEREGIVFRCGVGVGRDLGADDLRGRHDAVIVAVGARRGRPLDVDGSDLAGVHPAMDYLYARNRAVAGATSGANGHAISAAGRHVVVIGAGDTSADCMSNALREGAASVVQLDTYPAPDGTRAREIAGWPRQPKRWHTHYGLDEGGRRESAVRVTALRGRDGRDRRVCAVEGIGLGPLPDREPLPGTEFERRADLVLVAIGFSGVEDGEGAWLRDLGVELDEERNIVRDRAYATAADGIYVAGDARLGATLTVTALNDAQRCARVVDAHLRAR